MTEALGRVVATERKPNTPHEFHFWTAIDSPVGIGTIVRVDGANPMDGQIPHIYGIVVEGFSYTDLQSPMHDVLGHDGLPTQAGYASTERAEILIGQNTPMAAANFTIGVPNTLPSGGFAAFSSGVTARQKVPLIAPVRPGDTITVNERWF